LIVDLANPKDLSVIGNARFTLENERQGSGRQLDQANQLGEFSKILGAGEWLFKIVGGNDCTNELTIQIDGGSLVEVCIPLFCP